MASLLNIDLSQITGRVGRLQVGLHPMIRDLVGVGASSTSSFKHAKHWLLFR